MTEATGSLLRIVPLGGVGEVGKNCTLLEFDGDIILADVGVKFPEEEMLGIDLIIPDLSYVRERKERVRGIVITHGHEDHIGAIPYALAQLDLAEVPIYGSSLALGLVQARLEEHPAAVQRIARWFPVNGGDRVQLGKIEVEFISVDHSIPDAFSLAFHTPMGSVLHTGDWKFAGLPPESFERYKELGEEGLLALLPDCVRIESPGRTPSEDLVGDALEEIISRAPARVIISTFASNVSRVGRAIEAAQKYGRVCALVGRSMVRNIPIARDLGYLNYPDEALVTAVEAQRMKPEKVVLLMTGSQGEPTAALARMANGSHREVSLLPEDTVVLSASPIPGNEESVGRIIDNLMRGGAKVIYNRIMPSVHVSGHASYDEHLELYRLVRPRYLVPLHGEYRMMVLSREAAVTCDIPFDNVFLTEVGQGVIITENEARRDGRVRSGSVLVDGLTVGEVNQVVLRDRRRLASDGLVIVSVTLDRQTGLPVSDVCVLTQGLPVSLSADGANNLREQSHDIVTSAIEQAESNHPGSAVPRPLAEVIKQSVGSYIMRTTGLRPLIVPVLTEV
ncbi:MAG TPA: ribonuclease J [Chloroflexia bacterium]|nr:ribonuclease J [Chloroflexia bacterium]